MNRDQKAAVVEEVAGQIEQSDAVFAIDYRGLSVTQAVDLRARLGEAGTSFRVVKNRLTARAVDKAGAESLKEFLEGPTAFAFVTGDAALAAKALATFRREHGLLAFKGGTLDGEPLSVDQIESIARLPGRDQLQGQFVGVLASPLTGLVRGLGSLLGGLAVQLGKIHEQGLVGGAAPEAGTDASGSAGPDAASEAASAEAEDEHERAPATAGEQSETSSEAEGASEGEPEASDEAETKED
ncbi:MAG TPA: 50S ribosomal protein L10 [Thermoleophilaceae bacterium]|nr:50S ribosomal protein L10 [Thermoleophilaceae bacterium]